MLSYVYFCETVDGLIKIGWSESEQRIKSHEMNGHRLIAVVPGTETHEKNLKTYFSPLCERGTEWFKADIELLEYIYRLISRGYAGPSYETARYLSSSLPYSVWGPEGTGHGHPVNLDGQMSLLDRLPVRDRIKFASKDAVLSSISDNWFTPRVWADRARAAMGSIDLDPASCVEANEKYIRAEKFYTIEINGLDERFPWYGNIWLNPPYGRGENSAGKFTDRLCREFIDGNVKQAITCLNLNSMGNIWFMGTCAMHASAHLIVEGRINFIPPYRVDKESDSPTKGTVISYFGQNIEEFKRHFDPYGKIYFP